MSPSVALTQTVQKGGCAAKVPAVELRKILSQVQFPNPHEALLVDGRFFDDAGVYKITNDIAIVQTLDFFTPILDTPRLFGAVAAANALSDVYAMGGRPKTAMAILAFPLASMAPEVIVEVMQGASDKVAEAKANFVGGHSIDDDTLKFGLSVTGFVHPSRIWTNSGAKSGDDLILTKPIGTGTLTAALKRGARTESEIQDAIESMSTINNVIDVLSDEHLFSIHAATDITGFGLSGHAMQLAQASQVSLRIQASAIPLFSGVRELLKEGYLTKAHRTNHDYTELNTKYGNLNSAQRLVFHDPQTSGGLLISVASEKSQDVLRSLRKAFPSSSLIGKVETREKQMVLFE